MTGVAAEPRTRRSNAAALGTARKATILDAQIPIPDKASSWIARFRHDGGSMVIAMQLTAEMLLALGCLWVCLVIYRAYFSHRRPARSFSDEYVGIGENLTLLRHFAASECRGRFALLSFGVYIPSGLNCMLGRRAHIGAVARGRPITGDVEGYEREIAERQRAEAALVNSEAAAQLVEADARRAEFLAMLGHRLLCSPQPRYAMRSRS